MYPFPADSFYEIYGKNGRRFDALRFHFISDSSNPEEVYHQTRKQAWATRWKHCPVRLHVDPKYVSDLAWARHRQELDIIYRLQHILETANAEDAALDTFCVHPGLCVWSLPFQSMYWLNRERWGKDMAREARMRNHIGTHSCASQFMIGFHNLEFFSIPLAERKNFYVSKPNWWVSIEPSRFLCVPTPTVLAYLGSLVIKGSPQAGLVWRIAVTEWVILCFWAWINSACVGLHDFEHDCIAYKFYQEENDTRPPGRMFYLPKRLVGLIHHLGLPFLLQGADITEQVAKKALHRMEWYFSWHSKRSWTVYDWDLDIFPEERLKRSVPFSAIQNERQSNLDDDSDHIQQLQNDHL